VARRAKALPACGLEQTGSLSSAAEAARSAHECRGGRRAVLEIEARRTEGRAGGGSAGEVGRAGSPCCLLRGHRSLAAIVVRPCLAPRFDRCLSTTSSWAYSLLSLRLKNSPVRHIRLLAQPMVPLCQTRSGARRQLARPPSLLAARSPGHLSLALARPPWTSEQLAPSPTGGFRLEGQELTYERTVAGRPGQRGCKVHAARPTSGLAFLARSLRQGSKCTLAHAGTPSARRHRPTFKTPPSQTVSTNVCTSR
jgi:hypothetical protein